MKLTGYTEYMKAEVGLGEKGKGSKRAQAKVMGVDLSKCTVNMYEGVIVRLIIIHARKAFENIKMNDNTAITR